jgi:hypothetical protein
MNERFSVIAGADGVSSDLVGAFDTPLPALMLAEFVSRLAPQAWISVYAWSADGERCVRVLWIAGDGAWRLDGAVVYDYLEVKRRQAVA